MHLSIVIPAFNEEACLPATLAAIRDAMSSCSCPTELIVVDNASTDRTPHLARELGATVVHEAVHNISKVRNTGARAAHGNVLIFLDADTTVPANFLQRVAETMSDPACEGGSANIVHTPASVLLRAYLNAWRWLGTRMKMVQGAAGFCRSQTFHHLGGFDESHFMGEDVDFYWRLRVRCHRTGHHLQLLDDVKVFPSTRRFDRTPVWQTLLWTNPVFIAVFRRKYSAWRAWYVKIVR